MALPWYDTSCMIIHLIIPPLHLITNSIHIQVPHGWLGRSHITARSWNKFEGTLEALYSYCMCSSSCHSSCSVPFEGTPTCCSLSGIVLYETYVATGQKNLDVYSLAASSILGGTLEVVMLRSEDIQRLSNCSVTLEVLWW